MFQRLLDQFRALLVEDEASWSLVPPKLARFLRFWVMVGTSFVRNRCPVRATALAYSSLLAFIPLLAVVIGVSTSVLKNDADRIQAWIKDSIFRVAPQLQNSDDFGLKVDTLVKEINDMISNVHSGAVGTTGVLALLVMILFMLARVEETMNDIWGATRGRSWFSRLVNYWAAISLGPIVLFGAVGLSATINIPSLEISFAPRDVKDLSALVARVRSETDPAGRAVHGQLRESGRQLLDRYEPAQTASAPMAQELVLALNGLVTGAGVVLELPSGSMQQEGFALRPETKRLLGLPREADGLPRLNRMILEDAFPKELSRRPEWLSRYFGGGVGKLIAGLVQIPLLTLACAAFYAFMPNVKVQWRAALAGGLTAGILWYLNNTVSTKFVSQLTRNQAIYGSLAAVPVFMVGLYFFWMLLLFGAQVSYTFQNRRSYLAARQTERVHQQGREFAALRVMIECARDFSSGAPAPSVGALAERLSVPNDLVVRISTTLLQTRLLVEVAGTETGLAPGRPPDQIRVADVVTAMRSGVGSGLVVQTDPLWARAERELAAVGAAELAAGGKTLAELAAAEPVA